MSDPKIRLHEFPPTRSARCRWALLEAGLAFESAPGGPALIGSAELRRVHPLGKLPAIEIDGRPLFESCAIATHVADLVPEKGLVAPAGSWERALHDQWTSFVLTEMEAWLWSNALNTFVLPEDERNPSVFEQNGRFFKRAAAVLDEVLAAARYLVGDRFTAADIIAGYTVNWGRQQGLIDDLTNLRRYLDRLFERPHCTLSPE